jgi:6-phosphofructokinase 1
MSRAKRIAINAGGGFIPGLDLVVAGAVRAAARRGIEVFAIRNGYDGLLSSDETEGVVALCPEVLRNRVSLLGTGARIDPFHVRQVDELGIVREVDRSDHLLDELSHKGIDAVISVVGGSSVTGLHALTVAWKLARRGLQTVCIPKSIENDISGVSHPLGFDTALEQAALLLERIAAGAREAGRLAVVELPGQHAGWLALQAGPSAQADAILIPEAASDLGKLMSALDRHSALVVVAQGAALISDPAEPPLAEDLRKSLSPLSDPTRNSGGRVIDTSGTASRRVASELQRRTGRDVLCLPIGQLVRGGAPTALDRLLALSYGGAALDAVTEGSSEIILSYGPKGIQRLPVSEALAGLRSVPPGSDLIATARSIGLSFGD